MSVDTRKDVEKLKRVIEYNEQNIKETHKDKVSNLIDGYR